MNARLQSEAIKLGAVTYLSADEAAASAKTNDARWRDHENVETQRQAE
jgi:hypothetical protein